MDGLSCNSLQHVLSVDTCNQSLFCWYIHQTNDSPHNGNIEMNIVLYIWCDELDGQIRMYLGAVPQINTAIAIISLVIE